MYEMKIFSWWTLAGMITLAVGLAGGCGSQDDQNHATVEGTVALDGTSIEEGTIVFSPTAGTTGPAAYGQIAGGKYTLAAGDRGPVLGKHQVRLEGYRDLGHKNDKGEAIKEQAVPAQYNTATTLMVEVAKGKNTHNFELSSK
jgi:hypothetical protein